MTDLWLLAALAGVVLNAWAAFLSVRAYLWAERPRPASLAYQAFSQAAAMLLAGVLALLIVNTRLAFGLDAGLRLLLFAAALLVLDGLAVLWLWLFRWRPSRD